MSSAFMNWVGSWYIPLRNVVEADISAAFNAVAPEIKTVLITAAETGAQVALSTSGSVGDQFVAGRNAATAILVAQGQAVGADLVHALVAGAISANTASATTTAPTTPAS